IIHRSSHHPTPADVATATAKTRGANRIAKRGPNVLHCIAMSLRSTAGPTTMKTRRATDDRPARLDATNASASEQTQRRTARPPARTTPTGSHPAIAPNEATSTEDRSVAGAAAAVTSIDA